MLEGGGGHNKFWSSFYAIAVLLLAILKGELKKSFHSLKGAAKSFTLS